MAKRHFIKKVTETKTYVVYCSSPSVADAERWAPENRIEIGSPAEVVIEPWREMTETEAVFAYPGNQPFEE